MADNDTVPKTVAEWRVQIEAGKAIAQRRLIEHANDPSQLPISRDVCGRLAAMLPDRRAPEGSR
jgi:hypothetical protein